MLQLTSNQMACSDRLFRDNCILLVLLQANKYIIPRKLDDTKISHFTVTISIQLQFGKGKNVTHSKTVHWTFKIPKTVTVTDFLCLSTNLYSNLSWSSITRNYTPHKLCLWRGYTVFTSIRPSFHPSVCDILVFLYYLEKAMMEIHQTLQTHWYR